MWKCCGVLMRNLILTYLEGCEWAGDTILNAWKADKNLADTRKLGGCNWWRDYRMKGQDKHRLVTKCESKRDIECSKTMVEQKEGCPDVEARVVMGLKSTSDLCFRKHWWKLVQTIKLSIKIRNCVFVVFQWNVFVFGFFFYCQVFFILIIFK